MLRATRGMAPCLGCGKSLRGTGYCSVCVGKGLDKGATKACDLGVAAATGHAIKAAVIPAHCSTVGTATVGQQVALGYARRAAVDVGANTAVQFSGGAVAANAGVVVGPMGISVGASVGGMAGKKIVKQLGGGNTAQEAGDLAGHAAAGAALASFGGPIGAAGGAAVGVVSYGVKTAVQHPGEIASAVGTNAPAMSRKGTCQVLPQYWANCSGKVEKCAGCNYTYCAYHLKKGGTMSRGGHMCTANEQCSVVGPSLRNCSGAVDKCDACKYFYCQYHAKPGGIFQRGGHSCS